MLVENVSTLSSSDSLELILDLLASLNVTFAATLNNKAELVRGKHAVTWVVLTCFK